MASFFVPLALMTLVLFKLRLKRIVTHAYLQGKRSKLHGQKSTSLIVCFTACLTSLIIRR